MGTSGVARAMGPVPRTAPSACSTLSSLLLSPSLSSLLLDKASPRDPFHQPEPRHTSLPETPWLRSLRSLPLSSFYVRCPRPPATVSSPLSPSSLFYLNLPQICSPTKQLPSLFWAIICGSAAREGPPGRQSPGNRVSASYCRVCPSRSITRCLTRHRRRPESPPVHSWNLYPAPPRAGPRQDTVTLASPSRLKRAGCWLSGQGRAQSPAALAHWICTPLCRGGGLGHLTLQMCT